MPQIWAVSSGCRAQKGNNKEKCKAERVVHLLDPIGKAFAGQLWPRRTEHGPDSPSGFKPRRRREQTILQVKIARWRLAQHQRTWVAPLYDQASALASVDHEALNAVVRAALPPGDAELLLQRRTRAFCVLRADSGDWALMSLGCGDLQGDVAAPDKFINVLDPRVDRWAAATETEEDRNFFHVLEPITQTHINFSHGAYADDMFRMVLSEDAGQASSRVQDWD
eukprot:6687345-Pyramimonas_sp.AAC.1